MAGAPKGNTNSRRENRLWANTIRRAVVQSDGERLRRLAEALITKAEEGDVPALKEIGDRLDGKVPQAVSVSGENGGPLLVARPDELAAMTDEELDAYITVVEKLSGIAASDEDGDSTG